MAMSWVQRGLLVSLVGLGALAVMNGRRGSSKDGLDPKDSPIKGATYAARIPVYAGAKFDGEMGGDYYDDVGGPVTFTSHSWFFDVEDPVQQVVDFYTKSLPTGARRAEAEEGSVAFEWRPPGSLEGEEVKVWISEGRLQINEVVKAKPAS
jgi:hypothetical protein